MSVDNYKIAISESGRNFPLKTKRQIVDINSTNFVDVCAVIATDEDKEMILKIKALDFGIPIFVYIPHFKSDKDIPDDFYVPVEKVIDSSPENLDFYNKKIEWYATDYIDTVDSPFFKKLKSYCASAKNQFDSPGHQGGNFFTRHPAGKSFVDFFGENLFRADFSSSDVDLGDFLIHDGVPVSSEALASKVFNSDKTYFVLNGSSTSIRIVCNALLTPGDLVLYDRNNHKSNSNGALIEAGATPIFLETARNGFGSIGGILDKNLNVDYIKNLIKEVAPNKANEERPFRLAIIQLGTYDGTIYNARQIVDRIGKLCQYILFDSAWVGYEQFIPMMKDCSPLLLNLNGEDPGIIVVHSVHKQQAGFSQTSQILKKDKHIKEKPYYLTHKIINNAFLRHESTSPFYPLFTSLDVNAKMHANGCGEKMWDRCVQLGIRIRKNILKNCHYIKPLVPPIVHGKKWEEGDTAKMANDIEYFSIDPEAKWHGFEGYSKKQYFIDPCKLLLLTPGINPETNEYEDFGINANILINYLRDNGIISEKNDLNTILFLLTPAESLAKLLDLCGELINFEKFIDDNAEVSKVLPSIYKKYEDRYKDLKIRDLCQEMHNFYKKLKVKDLQKNLFLRQYFPKQFMLPQQANYELVRKHGEMVNIRDVAGRVALEGPLPYPPGIVIVLPGEIWTETARDYFIALLEGINTFPGFAPEIQGVYLYTNKETGKIDCQAYVLKKEYMK